MFLGGLFFNDKKVMCQNDLQLNRPINPDSGRKVAKGGGVPFTEIYSELFTATICTPGKRVVRPKLLGVFGHKILPLFGGGFGTFGRGGPNWTPPLSPQ